MKGLTTGIILVGLCIGSTAALAGNEAAVAAGGHALQGNMAMYLQTKNGDKIKILVPKSEVHKLKATHHGDSFQLMERKGALQESKHPYTNY